MAGMQRAGDSGKGGNMTRQQKFAETFDRAKRQVKQRFGNGRYSWAGEMTRKNARKIALGIARKEARP